MIRRLFLPACAAALLLGWGQLAYALPPATPDSDACVAAKATLDTKLAAVLQLPAELRGELDTKAELTPAALEALKTKAGANASAVATVQAAITAHAQVVKACTPPPPVVTPTPTAVPTTPPDNDTPDERPPTDTTDDGFDQVGEVPSGGVATGGGPAN